MSQPTLAERFREGPPTRGPEERHTRLTAEEHRFILWGLQERWSAARIGVALGINQVTVHRFHRSFRSTPKILMGLGLYEMLGRASQREYRCLVCDERVIGRREIQHHILAHYL